LGVGGPRRGSACHSLALATKPAERSEAIQHCRTPSLVFSV
jgi:hypothetical protein